MPLETPNRLVAAGQVLVNPTPEDDAPSLVYTLRNNNGLRNFAPNNDTSLETALNEGFSAELDTPISNDEAIVNTGSELSLFSSPDAFQRIAAWITPSYTQTGIASVDALAAFRLACVIPLGSTIEASGAGRLYLSVFKIATEVEAVDGQPLPPPAP